MNFVFEPKVTVVMPVYNGSRYLREAIESILAQTYTNFEFLIIDDGSTDGTSAIIQSYNDPRIRFIRNDRNQGVWKTMNTGLSLARGEYFSRMDSDDIALPVKLERQVAYLENKPEVTVISSAIIEISANGASTLSTWGAEKNAATYDQIRRTLIYVCCICNPTTLLRTNILKQYRFNEAFRNNGADYELWLHFCSDGLIIEKHSEPLLKFRKHSGSYTFIYARNQISRAKLLRMHVKVAFLIRRLKWKKWNYYVTRIFFQVILDFLDLAWIFAFNNFCKLLSKIWLICITICKSGCALVKWKRK